MAMGIVILFTTLSCTQRSSVEFVFTFIMYMSYLLLFLQLYFDKYKEGKEGKEKTKGSKNKEVNGTFNSAHAVTDGKKTE